MAAARILISAGGDSKVSLIARRTQTANVADAKAVVRDGVAAFVCITQSPIPYTRMTSGD